MTNATVLADALVEAGIGQSHAGTPGWDYYSISGEGRPDESHWMTDDDFITDWRVAGKVLESMTPVQRWRLFERWGIGNDPLDPRAIIEAWYAATEQGESDE